MEPLDDDDAPEITEKMFKDGRGQYRIAGKIVTREEWVAAVMEKLRDADSAGAEHEKT